MKKLWSLLVIGLLSACTSQPDTLDQQAVDNSAARYHQQQLQNIEQWRVQGQIAVFDKVEDKRDTVYVDWQQTSDTLSIRFYHPLKGTVAQLVERPDGAEFIDDANRKYLGDSAQTLLNDLFGMQLPLDLMDDLLLGRQMPDMRAVQYLSLNTKPKRAVLASYRVNTGDHTWLAELNSYENVTPTTSSSAQVMPHRFELANDEWRIKMRVTQWQL